MIYPCGIIKDLLPLYIDEVCNEESKLAVEAHLSECERCRNCCNAMRSTNGFPQQAPSEDQSMANSLKKVKHQINTKIKAVILCAAAAAVILIFGSYLLLNAALKEISPADVAVSANVYSLAELTEHSAAVPDSESVTIFSDEKDVSAPVEVKIPELGSVTLTEKTIEKCKYVSVISVSSDYFLRTVDNEIIDDTMYISAFKTSFFNNQSGRFNRQTISLEFREINQIIYIGDNGSETVLWSK